MNAFQQQIIGSMIGFLIAELIIYIVKKLHSKRKTIVYCKDCKHNDEGLCTWHNNKNYVWVVDDRDYCSVGERREK